VILQEAVGLPSGKKERDSRYCSYCFLRDPVVFIREMSQYIFGSDSREINSSDPVEAKTNPGGREMVRSQYLPSSGSACHSFSVKVFQLLGTVARVGVFGWGVLMGEEIFGMV